MLIRPVIRLLEHVVTSATLIRPALLVIPMQSLAAVVLVECLVALVLWMVDQTIMAVRMISI